MAAAAVHARGARVVTSGRVAKELPPSPSRRILAWIPMSGDRPGAARRPEPGPRGYGHGFGGDQRGVEGRIGGGQGIAAVLEAIHG